MDALCCQVRGVSTHSRPKAAGQRCALDGVGIRGFQHTAARRRLGRPVTGFPANCKVSTHSRPKAAGIGMRHFFSSCLLFQHTAARRRLEETLELMKSAKAFQHTAARRRLEFDEDGAYYGFEVSTHSRPKAAGFKIRQMATGGAGFNTQPPEGGWASFRMKQIKSNSFNTQPPEGGWFVRLA